MKIYLVTAYDAGIVRYYEPTKTKAIAKKKELEQENFIDGVTIADFDVEPTRAGIAQALNDVISELCANEN